MSIRNGGPDLANRPWTHLALIVTTIGMALVVGYGVGLLLNGTPEHAGVVVMAPEATAVSPPSVTPTVPSGDAVTVTHWPDVNESVLTPVPPLVLLS